MLSFILSFKILISCIKSFILLCKGDALIRIFFNSLFVNFCVSPIFCLTAFLETYGFKSVATTLGTTNNGTLLFSKTNAPIKLGEEKKYKKCF